MGRATTQSPAVLKKNDGAANIGYRDGETIQQKINKNLVLDNFDQLRNYDSSLLVNNGAVTLTEFGQAGLGHVRNVAGHGLTDDEQDIIVIDSDWYWQRERSLNQKMLQVDFPVNTITLSSAGVGALTGNYEYCINFYTAVGETSASGFTPQFSVTNEQIQLSNIPLSSDPRVIGRRIYRTYNGASDPVLKRLVVDIADNVTTSFIDNVADGGLGSPIPRINTTGGQILVNDEVIGSVGDGGTVLGYRAHVNNTGYANVAIGGFAMRDVTTGYRNTAIGLYAMPSLTEGNSNCALGVHAGQYLTEGFNNTVMGYAAGFEMRTGGDNTIYGFEAARFIAGTSSKHTVVGSRAMFSLRQALEDIPNTVYGFNALYSSEFGVGNIAIGAYAGFHNLNNNKLIIDTYNRGSEQNEIDNALIYGNMSGTKAAQYLKINGTIKNANADAFNAVDATHAGLEIDQQGRIIYSKTDSATENCQTYYHDGAAVGAIQVSGGTTTAFVNLSDERAKENIVNSTNALEKLQNINVRSFDWIRSGEHVEYGLIAQELYVAYPSAVKVGGEEEFWGIDPSKLVPLLIRAVQELRERVEELEA